MTDKQEVWNLAAETMRAFAPFYREAMRKTIQDSGAPPDDWFTLSLAHGSDPAPLTADRFHSLVPYTAPERLIETLENLAQLELLERVGENAYRLTGPGREAVQDIFQAAHQGLGTIEPLPAAEMEQLNGLLRRLVEATLAAPEPEEKWAMAYSRWTDPGADASGAAQADQYLTDLYRYRDDAHIAAWKPYGVSGQAWEALTFIWRGEASTAEELTEKLPRRSYTVQDYEKALQDLVARGWVVEKAGVYKLTEEGKQVREEAEEATDRHFYVGWSALSKKELAQLEDLLTRTKASLQAATLDQLWNLAGKVSQAIFSVTREAVNPLLEKHGLDQPGWFFALLSTLSLEPDPVSAARLGIRGPYTNPAQYDNLLTALAEVGFSSSRGGGEYVLTEEGRAALQETNHAFYTRLGELPALSAEELAQTEGLLKRVVEACLAAPELLGNGCVTKMHRAHPGQEYAPLAKIDQHLDDLNAFRDDAHLAAWRPYDVGGQAWEALTFIWRGEARTAEELAEKLPFRGHSATVYAGALANLASRGWVEETPKGYQVTEKGRALRQQAEDATNRYFFAPWACLSGDEKIQLHDLLTRLKNELYESAKSNVDDA